MPTKEILTKKQEQIWMDMYELSRQFGAKFAKDLVLNHPQEAKVLLEQIRRFPCVVRARCDERDQVDL